MTDWKTFYQQHDHPDNSSISQPDDWQLELAKILGQANPLTALEAGSGHGLTSMLLGSQVRKTLLDLEIAPLLTAQTMFAELDEPCDSVAGDLFALPFADNSFDLVFNSGVLEHFSFAQRRQALQEMIRVVKSGSRIVAAIPNHYSLPYRYSYLHKKKKGTWPYPDEHKLYNFSKELQEVTEAGQQARITLSIDAAYNFLHRHQRIVFKLWALLQRHEGYLTVITVQKKGR